MCQLFSVCFETRETGKKKGVGVWHAISTVMDDINSLHLHSKCYKHQVASNSVTVLYCTVSCLRQLLAQQQMQ